MKFYDYSIFEKGTDEATLVGTLPMSDVRTLNKDETIKLVESFTTLETSYISDCLDRLSGHATLRIRSGTTNKMIIKEANSIERDASSADDSGPRNEEGPVPWGSVE